MTVQNHLETYARSHKKAKKSDAALPAVKLSVIKDEKNKLVVV